MRHDYARLAVRPSPAKRREPAPRLGCRTAGPILLFNCQTAATRHAVQRRSSGKMAAASIGGSEGTSHTECSETRLVHCMGQHERWFGLSEAGNGLSAPSFSGICRKLNFEAHSGGRHRSAAVFGSIFSEERSLVQSGHSPPTRHAVPRFSGASGPGWPVRGRHHQWLRLRINTPATSTDCIDI